MKKNLKVTVKAVAAIICVVMLFSGCHSGYKEVWKEVKVPELKREDNGGKYMATVRHASSRTRVFEFLNQENPLGFYTGMGATFYYIDGDEYLNLMPIWDWNKIPGTTTRQGKVPTPNQDSSYNRYGRTQDVGGVSNGKVGFSTYKQSDKGVHAQKGYFMFEDGVVCLASDVRLFSFNDIITNINQTQWVAM